MQIGSTGAPSCEIMLANNPIIEASGIECTHTPTGKFQYDHGWLRGFWEKQEIRLEENLLRQRVPWPRYLIT